MTLFRTLITLAILFFAAGCSQNQSTDSEQQPDRSQAATSKSEAATPAEQSESIPTCDSTTGKGCLELGKIHVSKGEYTSAGFVFKTACDLSLAESCGEYGKLLAQGFLGGADTKGALDHYLIGCSGGHLPSCTYAGRLVSSAHAGAPDAIAALAFYEQACPSNHPSPDPLGCELLGLSLMRGEGKIVDFGKAKIALEHACNGGKADGCHHLGTLYGNGLGVEKNPTKAIELHTRACESGSIEACASAGVILHRGLGVEKNNKAALPMLKKGCLGGNKIACRTEQEIINSSEKPAP